MHVTRSPRDERGAIMVLSAILVPVLLVLSALIYDGGTWFTHKRQLQNRADAGALAAGVGYTTVWPACGSSDAQTKLDAANTLDDAARQYAGDPEKAGTLTLHNTELTDQNRINVEINSDPSVAPGGHVDPDTSWNDPAGTGLGPCDGQTTPDRFSPLASPTTPAHWVDVGVRERDQRSLFGMFGVDLFRNEAHARVELYTALAGKGFLPIALPDQDIRQVEIRYYWSCPSSGTKTQIGDPITLQQLGSAYQTKSGTAYWGPTLNNDGVPVGIDLNIPDEKSCGAVGNYISITEEVRLAGVDPQVLDVDDFTCAQLVVKQYADCWTDVSEVRVDKENPKSEPWFHHVTVVFPPGTGQCDPDAYFAKLKGTQTSCSYSGSVEVDWNDLNKTPPPTRKCTVSVGGTTQTFLLCANGSVGFSPTNSTLGKSTLNLTWSCTQQDPNPPKKDIPCPGTTLNTQLPGGIRSLFLGNRANSSLVTQVVTSRDPWTTPNGSPGAPIDWVDAPQNTPGGSGSPITVYPTVGLEGSLYVGQHRILRTPHCKGGTNSDNCDIDNSSPGDSQSIDCEPGGGTGGQGHDYGMFANGCTPWYGPNDYTDPDWWNTGTKHCPDKPIGQSAPWWPNDQGDPRRCVVKAPGFSPNVIADGIATAIGNCSDPKSNSCNKYTCVNANWYDPANPGQWAIADADGDGEPDGDPSERVVFLFIVPYGAYKNTGSQDTMPILTFAAFYITGWSGSGGAGKNPCEDPSKLPDPDAKVDEDTDGGDIAGYFVDYTLPDAPGDMNNVCVIGQLQPCVPVLVR
jgi:hypothetical protein